MAAARPSPTPEIPTVTGLHDRLIAAAESDRDQHAGNDLADLVIASAHTHRASDVHLDPVASGHLIRLRIDGALHDAALVGHEHAGRLINQFKVLSGVDPTTTFHPEEARWTHQLADERELDLRMTIAPCLRGPKVALRLLDRERAQLPLDRLGMRGEDQRRIEDWLASVSGMLICTGPTGSGKTTTLYALLRELIAEHRHIATVEDPPEFALDGINQIPVDPEHGIDYATGLHALLRMDPDYLMLGEVRDAAAAHVLMEAANAGRVALTSMHTRDAVSAITQLRNWGISDHVIAATASVVVSQRLVRRLCPSCRKKAEPNAVELRWMEANGIANEGPWWHPVGCDDCQGIGFHGRCGLFELWILDDKDSAAIRRGEDAAELQRRLDQAGFRRLSDDGLAKATAGETTLAELRAAAMPLGSTAGAAG